ncbi:SdpI family protein [Anaerocolumna xylanovorans]|uniref:Uncharacterized membrane protein n=1 Tax=Anaerocolumna xylanovorans DSM 12503 TaxID=1121345 RepID=A0A1M7YF25_9FIRM|nr:SdpI family protein [Anaerocolumna xylanovorans]SHO51244.1 Uncharacterized membrane protein [Anaerocolumna xylanovorans DSM 12503]
MSKRTHIILWIATLLSYIGILIVYRKLPQTVPIHWDSNWEANGYADKRFMFLIGALPAILNGFFYILKDIDPRRKNYDPKTYGIIRASIVVLTIFFTWVTVVAALKVDLDFKLFVPAGLGIAFLVIGNYLPKVKNNFFMGIKNPWTLSDDSVWRKTHKAGGYFFIALGILMLPIGVIKERTYSQVVFGLLLAGVIAINVYSYILYKRDHK